jgi:hypothetical protein
MLQQHFPVYTTGLTTLFFCGGLIGQLFVIAIPGQISTERLTAFFLHLGLAATLGMMTPLARSLPLFATLLAILAFTLFPLYGLGLDLALTHIPSNIWVCANKTLLSCYTIPAIISPLLFPVYPLPLSWGLPIFSSLCFVLAQLLARHYHHQPLEFGNMQKNSEKIK